MNKGIIMEKRREYMIVLTKDGAFHKAIPIKGVDIGMEVCFDPLSDQRKLMFMQRKKQHHNFFSFLAFVSMICLFVLPFYFVADNNRVYAYVGIDINPNPSIEFKLDEDLHVQGIRSINDEAKRISQHLMNYKDKNAIDVIPLFIEKVEQAGLTNKNKQVIIGISSLQETDVTLFEELKEKSVSLQGWKITTVKVPNEIRNVAEAQNLSMNELMAKELAEKNPMRIQFKNVEELKEEDRAIIQSFYNY
ncbi:MULTISPECIES: anti-sigma factor domain-containing protein [Virgibacillus]|uniref:Anti-sigma factor domain-containing protein n=1 Tax=Virgibacillus dokdonensis TaxID=302167 RepID=A0A2K9J148_9BACI|nr:MULTISPECIES: anti-sigma factor domain-containing protein [Virgibacillus]AUJ25677.1 Anti-sigma-I factor RsgI [Virgibacillus dokdonensis]NWO13402.1 anti-sigma factor domain-containing protein [Virgibacillus sp.]